jgi:O-acetyl-ADP-ribose deacetylase (regulator of RNase III)
MKRQIICSDIVEVPSDALIYSTNVRLTLTGGVGAALLKKFGFPVQIGLQNQSSSSGRHLAEVGDIIENKIAGGPWKKVFHTIATDEMYHTDPDVVRSILKRCFRRCAENGDVLSVTCSALGSGYGDLDLAVFATIAEETCRQFDSSVIESFSIVSCDSAECDVLRSVVAADWTLTNG